MVTAGDHVNTGSKDFLSRSRRDARTARGVFAVSHNQVHRMLLAQTRNQLPDSTAAGLADDVTNEEQFHTPTLMGRATRAKRFRGCGKLYSHERCAGLRTALYSPKLAA